MRVILELYEMVPQKTLCTRLDVHRSVVHRAVKAKATANLRMETEPTPSSESIPANPKRQPNKLSEAEVAQVRATCTSDEFKDLAVRQIFAILLGRGQFLCSIRTMYRILKNAGLDSRRGRLRSHPTYHKPQLVAKKPLEVLCYDITRIPGPRAGQWYYWYVIIDLFSRTIVGHSIQESETGFRVRRLLVETFRRHKIKRGEAGGVTIHSDRGAQMKSRPVMGFLAEIGINVSFSRPRVSNDNPFIESLFKTGKYCHTFPKRFASLAEAGAYLEKWVKSYNTEHHHSSLALFTPEQVFTGAWRELVPVHQAALDLAFANHPERFTKGRPIAKVPPAVVELNPVGMKAINVAA